MCLNIDCKKHRKLLFAKDYKPVKLKTDLFVYKYLKSYNEENHIAYTPLMDSPVFFKNSKYRCSPFSRHQFIQQTALGFKDGEGYHAYLHPQASMGCWYKRFHALIPAGSYVYYGKNDEICANQMIIFESFRAVYAAIKELDF